MWTKKGTITTNWNTERRIFGGWFEIPWFASWFAGAGDLWNKEVVITINWNKEAVITINWNKEAVITTIWNKVI